MLFRFPKNDKKYRWTQHIKDKMMFYRISEQKIKTILKNPARREEGIAPNTVAVMKRNDTPKRKEEIWVMFTSNPPKGVKTIMISTWRYPGISKAGKEIPIPDSILDEIKKEWF